MSDGFVTAAQCVEGLPVGRGVWELLICCFLAWFLLGSISETSPISFSLVHTEWSASGPRAAALAASLSLGLLLSALFGGWLADRHGRLSVVRPALVMTVACGVTMQTARSFFQAVVARFVLGLASGGLLAAIPPLAAELLPARHRSFYMTAWCAGWPAGALFSLMVGCIMPSLSWQSFCTAMLVPAAVLYVCTRADMLPESPRYLYLVGRRDEGYNTLLDMYEKEQLQLPWAPETVSVACAAPMSSLSSGSSSSCHNSSKGATTSTTAVIVWLFVAMFSVSAAAQSMKLWLPTMLVAQQADAAAATSPLASAIEVHGLHFAAGPQASSLLAAVQVPLMLATPRYAVVLVLAQALTVQLLAVLLCAFLSTWVNRRQMVYWSFILGAIFSLAALWAAETGWLLLCGPLLGAQLGAQSAGLNFLQLFATEYFPTSRRAMILATAACGAQLGSFLVPALGGRVVQHFSAGAAILVFTALSLVGWLAALRLPLPSSKDRPLHDVEEPKCPSEARGRMRKQEWVTYQTI